MSPITILICSLIVVFFIGLFTEIRVYCYKKIVEERDHKTDRLAKASIKLIEDYKKNMDKCNMLQEILFDHFSETEIKDMIRNKLKDKG
ncbi:hypothetical protein FKN04_22895 [Bacillus glycinifermentans]|uniref:hypothetical protein n=1 Tax=Bacillus TaxID=1386 RepID=UPI001581A40C|nr:MULTISPECIES: hypothetical protein [Bacillus]NUJ19381.1 hypothetical protein [Bacillus glycinifermentans]GIN67119.1 hypothetical protein J41TS2_25400 [Bacillus sonorensis]